MVGKGELIEKVIITLLSEGHLLLEDVPGVGKTTIAKALSDSLSVSFARIQCTPDVMPSDITGLSVYDQSEGSFRIVKGPVINNIVLADELNRTSPKTQSALLEVMAENKVTIDGTAIPLPAPFMVIGTQNPSEMAGTYPIPESQMDRFMVKLSVGYPDTEAEEDMAAWFLSGQLHEETQAVLTGDDIIQMQNEVKKIKIHENLRAYGVAAAEATRVNPMVRCGASPRAMLSMFCYARGLAYVNDRDYCIPEDIREAVSLTLPHRIVLTTDAKLARRTADDVIAKILQQLKVPT